MGDPGAESWAGPGNEARADPGTGSFQVGILSYQLRHDLCYTMLIIQSVSRENLSPLLLKLGVECTCVSSGVIDC